MNDANKNLQELTQKLEAGVQELFAGEKYQNYLNAMAKFHQYSFRNSILIFLQNPEATRVAGFNAWKALGRSVNKGEHGLQILAPAPYKKTLEVTRDENGTLLPEPQKQEITVAAFCPAYVFDISQTTGKELPTLATQLTGAVKKYDMLFHSLLAASPCPIAVEPIENGADSYYLPEEQCITVREGMSEEQTVKALIHEIAHAKFKHGTDTNRKMAEIQAESVAYVVCQHLGIDSSQYSFGYVARWSKDKDSNVLKNCLASIQTVAKDIINDVEISIKRDRIMEREPSVIGTISFPYGTTSFTDVKEYIGAIKEELPDCNASGFRFKTLTDDAQVRKAVDDTVYELHGEKNPHDLQYYEQCPTRTINERLEEAKRICAERNHPIEERQEERPEERKKSTAMERLQNAVNQITEQRATMSAQEHTQSKGSDYSR